MSGDREDGPADVPGASRKQQAAEARKARLEASLRQNIRKRKAQAQARESLERSEDLPIDD